MPKTKQPDLNDFFDGWPENLQKTFVHAIHLAATLDGGPKRCRLRECRRAGNCKSRLTSMQDIACHGGLSDAGERMAYGMLLILFQFATPDDPILLRPEPGAQ